MTPNVDEPAQPAQPAASTFRLGFENATPEPLGGELAWTGKPLPDWLDGAVLVRNGPGLFHLAEERMRHWFDGLALLNRFEFSAGAVRYRSAYLASREYVESTRTGRAQFTEFGTAPKRSLWRRLGLVARPRNLFGDNASVNVIPVNGEWWALWDVPNSMRLDGQTLATIGPRAERFDHRAVIRTPHPIRDEEGDQWINVGVGFTLRGPAYTVMSSREPTMEMEHLVSIPSWTPAYLHSFAMSRRHLVITEHSFGPTVGGGINLLLGSKPLADSCRWRRRHRTRLLVVDRDVWKVVQRIEIDPVAVLHHVNAFEDADGILHVDVCAFSDREVINRLFFRFLDRPDGGCLARGTLQRYSIDVRAGTASVRALTSVPLEMPFFDRRRAGLAYRYAYGVSMARDNDFNDELVKVDLHSAETTSYFEAGTYPGEPIFVARPGSDAEDDGVVLSLVLDANRGCSFLVALDARSFTELGRARLPHMVPHGLHGTLTLADHGGAR